MNASFDDDKPPVVGVAGILRRIKGGLNRLGAIRIRGEIHSIKPYPSGHVYLDLKDSDDDALLHCVIWRRHAILLERLPEQGEVVILTGGLDVFEVRGQLQFNVTAVESAGDGALFAKFEALKRKLAAEGLFETALKKSLPRYPSVVGVVTSRDSAALQDVLKTRAALAPWVRFVVYHAAVQGEAAEGEILAALRQARQDDQADVLLLVRGGGSLADLWSFNSEAIARELRRMPVPVVTGVGHETDFTIADMAADVRAPTPTGACSLVLQQWASVPQHLENLQKRLASRMQSALRVGKARLGQGQRLQAAMRLLVGRLSARVPDEAELRRRYERYLDGLTQRLDRNGMALAAQRRLLTQTAAGSLQVAERTLLRMRPRFDKERAELTHLKSDLARLVQAQLQQKRFALEKQAAALDALDVSKTLARGFTLALDGQGRVVKEAAQLRAGDALTVHFARGWAQTRVVDVCSKQ